jgi:di/tricarboxylate transporter
MMSLVAVLTALISLSGAVAAMLPVVVMMPIQLKRAPSQLLMPLAFAGRAGSLLVLTGTAVNVLVSEAAVDAGLPPFGFFSFAVAGVPLLVGTIAIVVFFGQRLLPERSGRSLPADLGKHATTLVEQYRLDDGLFQLRIRAHSPYVGSQLGAVDLSEHAGLVLVAIQTGDGSGQRRRPALAEGDIITVRGDAQSDAHLAFEQRLAFRAEGADDVTETLFNRTSGLAEVVIPPRSAFVGQPVFPGMVTPRAAILSFL